MNYQRKINANAAGNGHQGLCQQHAIGGKSMTRHIKKTGIFFAACVLLIMAGYSYLAAINAATADCPTTGHSPVDTNDIIKIAHRSFAEQRILGQLLAVYLESKGYKTEVSEYPGIKQSFNELQSGNVDVYAEYTGTLYTNILNQTKTLSKYETYNYVKNSLEKEYGITLLNPLGWNNTYVLSVRPETAETFRLQRISDIIPVSHQLVLGSDELFANRKDGLIGLLDMYHGLNFKGIRPMNQALTYQALIDGITDINASYSTDAEIEEFGLINLIDDKNYFPPYYVSPILKISFAEKNPEVVAALNDLGDRWTEKEIAQYNYMVDQGQDPRAVAEMMLRDKGLL